jgi:hypothetical protein
MTAEEKRKQKAGAAVGAGARLEDYDDDFYDEFRDDWDDEVEVHCGGGGGGVAPGGPRGPSAADTDDDDFDTASDSTLSTLSLAQVPALRRRQPRAAPYPTTPAAAAAAWDDSPRAPDSPTDSPRDGHEQDALAQKFGVEFAIHGAGTLLRRGDRDATTWEGGHRAIDEAMDTEFWVKEASHPAEWGARQGAAAAEAVASRERARAYAAALDANKRRARGGGGGGGGVAAAAAAASADPALAARRLLKVRPGQTAAAAAAADAAEASEARRRRREEGRRGLGAGTSGSKGTWEEPKRYRAGRSAEAARVAIAVNSAVGRKQQEDAASALAAPGTPAPGVSHRGGSDAVWAMTPEEVLASLVPGVRGGGGSSSPGVGGGMGAMLMMAAQMKLKNRALKMRERAAAGAGGTAAAGGGARIKTPYVDVDTAAKIAKKVRDTDAFSKKKAAAAAAFSGGGSSWATAPARGVDTSTRAVAPNKATRGAAVAWAKVGRSVGRVSEAGSKSKFSGDGATATVRATVRATVADAAAAAVAAAVADAEAAMASRYNLSPDDDDHFPSTAAAPAAAFLRGKAPSGEPLADANANAHANAAPEPEPEPEFLELEGMRILELMWNTRRDPTEMPFSIANLEKLARAGTADGLKRIKRWGLYKLNSVDDPPIA